MKVKESVVVDCLYDILVRRGYTVKIISVSLGDLKVEKNDNIAYIEVKAPLASTSHVYTAIGECLCFLTRIQRRFPQIKRIYLAIGEGGKEYLYDLLWDTIIDHDLPIIPSTVDIFNKKWTELSSLERKLHYQPL